MIIWFSSEFLCNWLHVMIWGWTSVLVCYHSVTWTQCRETLVAGSSTFLDKLLRWSSLWSHHVPNCSISAVVMMHVWYHSSNSICTDQEGMAYNTIDCLCMDNHSQVFWESVYIWNLSVKSIRIMSDIIISVLSKDTVVCQLNCLQLHECRG